jgi:preprotein translocase subunit SecG
MSPSLGRWLSYNVSFDSSLFEDRAVPLPSLPLAVSAWIPGVLNVLILLVGVFLVFLILIQRGKGGGLAGAFGGAGGSSAFGSRAGDTFTRITITVAAVWVLLIMIMVKIIQPQPTSKSNPADAEQPDQQQDTRLYVPPVPWERT